MSDNNTPLKKNGLSSNVFNSKNLREELDQYKKEITKNDKSNVHKSRDQSPLLIRKADRNDHSIVKPLLSERDRSTNNRGEKSPMIINKFKEQPREVLSNQSE